MRFLVVGAGSWGTAFTRLLLDREHEVVLACRTAEQAETIAETGWNPHHLQHVDLSGARGDRARGRARGRRRHRRGGSEPAFGDVVEALPGDAPVLSLAKGLDPATGERLSTRVRAGRSRCSPARTWRRRSPRACRPRR